MPKVYGSITISDIADVGRLSVYLTSNQPQTVIENPNGDAITYTPDWTKNNLVLTPIIYFNEKQLQLPCTGLTVTWKRQEGSEPASELKEGETVKNGILTVSQNFLSKIQSGLLTYIVGIQYTDPITNTTLETQSQMSFSLSKQAIEAKYCSITGESVFLYNTNQTLVGSDTITLTANVTNVNISQWQYKKSDGSFVVIPTTNNPTTNGTSIIIKANESALFVNDTVIIKLVTDDPTVYDLHTITKIRDGAAGNSSIAVVLSNEDHTLPCNSKGEVSSYIGAETSINVFEGGTDVTTKWSIATQESEGVSGTFENNKYTVSNLTVDVGYVEFTCTKSGSATLKKRFTLTKQYAGLDGEAAVVYSLKSSTLSMNVNKSGTLSPANVTFSAFKQVGAETSQTVYNGRFKIYESPDGLVFGTAKYTSSSDESNKTYTPSSSSIRAIKCELYASGGVTNILDSQTVIITKDGSDGEAGDNGIDAISIIMGNEAEVIPCKPNGTVSIAKDITIPFYAYKGLKRIPVTCSTGTLPSGVTVKTNTSGTINSPGTITINIPVGNELGSASDLSGSFTLTFTCEGVSVDKKFSWTKSIQATNAVMLQIYAPQGNVIVNAENNVLLEAQITDGGSVVESGVTYQWAKFDGGKYTDIPSANKNTITVTPDMVNSLASFRCTVGYNGRNYIAYWTVTDKNDPVELLVMSTVGTQLTKDADFGVIYVLAYLNGKEIDAIKSTVFSTTPPSGQTGDFYYHVDKVAKKVILKKHNGTGWIDATGEDLPKGTYKYFRRNSEGVELDKAGIPWNTGKAVFVDRTIIDGSTAFMCEADIPLA